MLANPLWPHINEDHCHSAFVRMDPLHKHFTIKLHSMKFNVHFRDNHHDSTNKIGQSSDLHSSLYKSALMRYNTHPFMPLNSLVSGGGYLVIQLSVNMDFSENEADHELVYFFNRLFIINIHYHHHHNQHHHQHQHHHHQQQHHHHRYCSNHNYILLAPEQQNQSQKH